ncbi:hypothetical protein K8374_09540 [Pseudomonas sp. p1(2021b)]|uniref:hypothetical protein n=1 Tax=Pseudomonas sp. p1(2021b) TaxID=2874628 RepID=UPI001CCC4480|nr:hypothetical protein [Pseudomonas sp. p1(2021b)]UBM27173.1 hypothetical protein K8374_09540 [Pseudomonas sp. p1(2021b)]
MEKSLDELIARLQAIRESEGRDIDLVGPGLDLIREHRAGADGGAECHALRLHLVARE